MTDNEIRKLAREQVLRLLENPPKQVEDDVRFELKSKWPEPNFDTARKLAAHANTARGEPFIWIIGVKEKTGEILGADLTEFSQWFAQVKSYFDEAAPEPRMFTVSLEGSSFVAIYFENDPPYVVVLPELPDKKGQVKREVPYRVGTAAYSITRSQLFRLLIPLSRVPSIEIIKAEVTLRSKTQDRHYWFINCTVFVTPQSSQVVTLAQHLTTLTVMGLNAAKWTSSHQTKMVSGHIEPSKAGGWQTSLTIDNPEYVMLRTEVAITPDYAIDDFMKAEFIQLQTGFIPAGLDHKVLSEAKLVRKNATDPIWHFGPDKSAVIPSSYG